MFSILHSRTCPMNHAIWILVATISKLATTWVLKIGFFWDGAIRLTPLIKLRWEILCLTWLHVFLQLNQIKFFSVIQILTKDIFQLILTAFNLEKFNQRIQNMCFYNLRRSVSLNHNRQVAPYKVSSVSDISDAVSSLIKTIEHVVG